MPTQRTILTGLVQTPASPAADATGDYCVPADSRQRLAIRIKNGSGAAITVTLDDVNSVAPDQAQQFNADVQVPVPAGAERVIAITDTARFLNIANGRVSWSYSAAASVTVDVHGL